METILQNIGQSFPEIHPTGGWQFGDPGLENSAGTNPWSGQITVDKIYSKACLSFDEFNELYFDLLHESMHSTDPIDTRMWDNMYAYYTHGGLTQNHQSIYNRESWEQWGVVPSETAAQGVWGYRAGERRPPPIVRNVRPLYDATRPCSCNNR